MEGPNLRVQAGGFNQRGDSCQYLRWELRDGGVRLIAKCSKMSKQESRGGERSVRITADFVLGKNGGSGVVEED